MPRPVPFRHLAPPPPPRPRVRVRRLRARVAVLAIVSAAGLAALGCSALLHQLGVAGMGPRWIAAVLVAYAVFLALVRVFLVPRRRRETWNPLDGADPLDLAIDGAPGPSAPPAWGGGGGTFHGGGATVRLDPASDPLDPAVPGADGGGLDGGVDGDAWPLVAGIALAAIAAAALLAAGWVVYGAPELVADLLLDGVASGVVYRRLRASEAWWETALRHTWAPAVVTLVASGIAGFVLDATVPAADTIREVLAAIPWPGR